MIKTLTLGNKIFPNNLIQGPLAGISCAPFRVLSSRYSQPAFTCTEMISVKTLIDKPKSIQRRYLTVDPREGPVCFQLAGNDLEELAEAVKIVSDRGASLIDLNCGCPVKKMRKKGVGSSLLSQSSKLYQLIQTMKNNTWLPVSIKIRVDGNSNDKFNSEIANVVSDAGADFLIVHGRHWTEDYKIPCHYRDIQFFVENLKISVIGNGDIKCSDSLKQMFSTGCAGVMLSRSGVGQPWLIDQLKSEINNLTFIKPSIVTIGELFIEHITDLSHLLSNETIAVLEARKFAKYYARDLINKNEFCISVNQCLLLEELKEVIQSNFL